MKEKNMFWLKKLAEPGGSREGIHEEVKRFDTRLQYHKFEILREIASLAFRGENIDARKLAEKMNPGAPNEKLEAEARKIQIALGEDKNNPNVIITASASCNRCRAKKYRVTDACQACEGRFCADACRFDAFSFGENGKSKIDPEKCKNCSACSKACPYGAIVSNKRPCQIACKVDAIEGGDGDVISINNDKCVSCGACVRRCPFGAILDKSFILDAINLIKESENGAKYKVYALVAPSVVGQFDYASLGQIAAAIKKLGFFKAIETAIGADITAIHEAKELSESREFVTSSCCPAFVSLIRKHFPDISGHISETLTPMASIGKRIKELDKTAKCVFIGPCVAKKMEFQRPDVAPYVDCAITFEELEALFASCEIDARELPEDEFSGASRCGRIFARSGGLSEAVLEALKENGCDDFECKAVACGGVDECKIALLKAAKGLLPNNFIEGMACPGGCVGGPAALRHDGKFRKDVDEHGNLSTVKTMTAALDYDINEI
jgi:[FeFe] hydrogenase (group B1/B3)